MSGRVEGKVIPITGGASGPIALLVTGGLAFALLFVAYLRGSRTVAAGGSAA